MSACTGGLALKSALLAGTAAVVAAAQNGARASHETPIERIVVTGSRLPQRGLTSLSPVVTVEPGEGRAQGTTSIDMLLNSMPQVSPLLGPEVNEGSPGTGLVDLRRLGPYRTLVLIDGRRMPMGFANFPPHADLNMIPLALVERVELLTGGASAVYGADAIAGVVNIILRKDFDATAFGAQVNVFQHSNDDAQSRARIAHRVAAQPEFFPLPPRRVTDGAVTSLGGYTGTSFADDRGGITLYAQYRHAEAVLQSARDFSACDVASDFSGTTYDGYFAGLSCVGSSNSAFGRFRSADRIPNTDPLAATFKATAGGSFVLFDDEADAFNQAPAHYLHRPDERILVGARSRYRFSDGVETYAELAVGDDTNTLQRGQAAIFRGRAATADGLYRINCDNPFLASGTPGARPFDVLCGAGTGLGPADDATVDIGRRFTGLPPRRDEYQYTTYRGLLGATASLGGNWEVDVYAQYGDTYTRVSLLNNISLSRINKALQVVDADPGAGVAPVCKAVLDGSDLACVPANIFQLGQLTREAQDYLTISGRHDGRVRQTVASASAVGDLGRLKLFTPSPIDVAIGAELRREELEHMPDAVTVSGDIPFFDSTPVRGRYDVAEVFGEFALSLIEDAPMAQRLEFAGGYRYSHYATIGDTHTYKYGLNWTVDDNVRLRASQQRAVRAPNIVELFSPVIPGGWSGQDPCASIDGTAPPVFSEAQCVNTGLSPAQYALFAASNEFQCPTDLCSARYGGSDALSAEDSDTTTFGIVLTPRALKGFALTIDYYEIELSDAVGVYPAQFVLQRCADTDDPAFCTLIQRAAGTGVLFGSGGHIDLLNSNVGRLATSGIDVDARYRAGFDALGTAGHTLTLNFVATKQLRHEQEPSPGAAYDCTGLFGFVCGAPWFDWRHKLRATWDTPFGLELSLAWRHMSEVELDANTSDPFLNAVCGAPCGDQTNPRIQAYNYLDVGFTLDLTDALALHGGINNLTDEDPPLLDPQIAMSPTNSYAGVYDLLGREAFIGITLRD